MKATYRLKSKKQFNTIYNKGSWHKSKYLVVVYSKSVYAPKFGFSVSKKFGKATKRNRIKRQLKECVYNLLPRIKPNYCYIFVVRSGIPDKYPLILDCVTKLLSSADLLLD
ncbi:MAG: ribonuclease P protein component [Clostridia bacterium]|nr:ribonuclease P protein component [Clostridia bacterium]